MMRNQLSRLQERVRETFVRSGGRLPLRLRSVVIEMVANSRLNDIRRRMIVALYQAFDEDSGHWTSVRFGDLAHRVRCHDEIDFERVLDRLIAEEVVLCFESNYVYITSLKKWWMNRNSPENEFSYGQGIQDFWNLRVMLSPYYAE